MTGRRAFLKASSGTMFRIQGAPSRGTLAQARGLVRRGALGPIAFCRIAHEGLVSAAQYVLGQGHCIVDIEPEEPGLALLGARATLSISAKGIRLFARES
jgi:hypothetical protein